jgi:uncharacterized repeat protein (TIGR03803 family)
MMAAHLSAQTFTSLYNFTDEIDGSRPFAGLISSGNALYGTAAIGGDGGYGTVFVVNDDGSGFTTLYSFTDTSDGAAPQAALVLSGNTLYGTALDGDGLGNGSAGGTVFSVRTDGTGFTTLYSFTNSSDGANPAGGLILSGKTLYGTTLQGGSSRDGTVFSVNTDGTGFTTLYAFTNGSDGANPRDALVLSNGKLFGTAGAGGSWGNGTVFAVNTDGTGFRVLHSFTATAGDAGLAGFGANIDGASPHGGLVLLSNTLYGMAPWGGNSGDGTLFAVNTDGTGFTTLHSFTDGSDGAAPNLGQLILSGNTLFGTTVEGGSSGDGAVFGVNTDGTGFTTLYSFTNGSDGANPEAGLVLSGNTFYGTANKGGSEGYGTLFSLSLPPVSPPLLTINLSGTNVVLTWPTSSTAFTLQFTTNLGLPAIWITNSSAPVLVNGQNTVTNAISSAQQFYRLTQ